MSQQDPHYGLVVKTAPATEPVTAAEVIDQLREDVDLAQTDLIDRLIPAAREWAEQYLHRALITTTFTMTLDGFAAAGQWWPGCRSSAEVRLPRSRVISVDAIRYIDTAGDEQTLAADNYRVDTKSLVGRITPAYGYAWPVTRPVTNAVEIDFKAGYGAATTDVPDGIRSAIIYLAAHMYENRLPVVVGTIVSAMPMTAQFLLGPYRVRD